MRVLIAARFSPDGARPIGGVQSWSRTVGDVLKRRGYKVAYWEKGKLLAGTFDLGIISNICDTRAVTKFCAEYVSVSHGIIAPEKPFSRHAVFTSEEVRSHWNVDGPVIRQPIDLDFWNPAKLPACYLTRFSYRAGLDFIPAIAKGKRLQYRHVRNSNREAVRGILRRSACVLATGRAALEAMACGVPTIICDHRESYQKPLMELDLIKAMHHNYSGRNGITPTPQNVTQAIEQAMSDGNQRAHIEAHHDSNKIVDQLLEFAG